MLSRRTLIAGMGAMPLTVAAPALAEDREVIDTRVNLALGKMYSKIPNSRQLSSSAKAMLVMPEVLKGGLIVGGSYGEGALLENTAGEGYAAPAVDYFSVAAASFGLQIGVQTSSHVIFFMTDDAYQRFRRADGWEVGVDAEVTFPDNGLNAQVNSTLLNKPVVGVVFAQDGILVGASLEGAKYSRIVR